MRERISGGKDSSGESRAFLALLLNVRELQAIVAGLCQRYRAGTYIRLLAVEALFRFRSLDGLFLDELRAIATDSLCNAEAALLLLVVTT